MSKNQVKTIGRPVLLEWHNASSGADAVDWPCWGPPRSNMVPDNSTLRYNLVFPSWQGTTTLNTVSNMIEVMKRWREWYRLFIPNDRVWFNDNIYRKTYDIRRTFVGSKTVDHSDVVGASAMPQLHLHSRYNTSFQWNGQKQLIDETRNIYALRFGAAYIRSLALHCVHVDGHLMSAIS